MELQEARAIIEALLFSADKPISVEQIKEVLEEIDSKSIQSLIKNLQDEYESQGRSFQLVEVAGGFRMSTRPQFGPWLKKFYKVRHRERLTAASLETLSIIAYKQPVIRSEIESIRGVDVAGVLHSLLEKRLIRVMGRKMILGRPLIYGTTDEFLEHFGLRALSELPKMEELVKPQINTDSHRNTDKGTKDDEVKYIATDEHG
ncbi:SMC-Scp complex subunit ScpB [candidate division NPL-UPA2 bacterium]|nr:SMC-Scp complex subunit ScpB [candidate division NPL-UPA2 bacterium]